MLNFPFTCGNITAAPAYGVYRSQRLWLLYDLLDRGELLNKGFLVESHDFEKFTVAMHQGVVNLPGMSVSQMTTDMFRLS
jgi:hypothetical protein